MSVNSLELCTLYASIVTKQNTFYFFLRFNAAYYTDIQQKRKKRRKYLELMKYFYIILML